MLIQYDLWLSALQYKAKRSAFLVMWLHESVQEPIKAAIQYESYCTTKIRQLVPDKHL